MPCDSVTTQSINLANALPDILREAMESIGLYIDRETPTEIIASNYAKRVIWTKGQGIEVKAARTKGVIKDLTKAYSSRAVSWAAQRAGWQVAQTGNPDQLTVTRR